MRFTKPSENIRLCIHLGNKKEIRFKEEYLGNVHCTDF